MPALVTNAGVVLNVEYDGRTGTGQAAHVIRVYEGTTSLGTIPLPTGHEATPTGPDFDCVRLKYSDRVIMLVSDAQSVWTIETTADAAAILAIGAGDWTNHFPTPR